LPALVAIRASDTTGEGEPAVPGTARTPQTWPAITPVYQAVPACLSPVRWPRWPHWTALEEARWKLYRDRVGWPAWSGCTTLTLGLAERHAGRAGDAGLAPTPVRAN